MDQAATAIQTKEQRLLEIQRDLAELRRRAMFAGMLTDGELGDWGRLTLELEARQEESA